MLTSKKIDKYYDKIEEMYIQHRDMMYREAYTILKDPFYAEDAVHQVILRIINCADRVKFDQRGMTCNFLKVITRNIAIDMCNDKNKYELNDEAIDYAGSTKTLYQMDVSEYIESKEAMERIIQIINSLPAIYSEILFLEKICGFKRKETMVLLKQSNDTLKKRMTRAKHKLLEELKKEGLNDEREKI